MPSLFYVKQFKFLKAYDFINIKYTFIYNV